MFRKSFPLLAAVLLPLTGALAAPKIEGVAEFPNDQVTGLTVSKTGRIFVCFPFWGDKHSVSVAEVKEGRPVPYPDKAWNMDEGDPSGRFVCVQSVVADDAGALWVLDPAAPKMGDIKPGGPKIVKIDLATNKVVETIPVPEEIAPQRSYLNDIRIDTKKGKAIITESGVGSVIVLDLATKKFRKLLSTHPSTQPEAGTDLVVDGMRLLDPKTQATPTLNADGLALTRDGWVFFRPLTGHSIYKVKEADLLDESLSDAELGTRVTKAGESAATDGMLESSSGKIYCAAFEKNAIQTFDPSSGKTETVVQDKRLQWPDTMSWGPDGSLYVTTSQIHRMPKWHKGESKQLGPYEVLKITGLGEQGDK